MLTSIKPNERLRYINSMLGDISNIYQKLLMVKNIPESVYIIFSSILEFGEGCLQKDIAERSSINKKTVNTTIKKLQKDEFIVLKAGKYPNMHIYLTKKGREYIQANIIPIIEVKRDVLNSMSDKEFEVLVDSYMKYIDNFRERAEEFAIRNNSSF